MKELPKGVFNNNSKLISIVLQKNYIQDLEGVFERAKSLKAVNLRFNRIQIITDRTFAHCYALRMVNLEKNRLKTIHSNAFLTNPVLYNLDLTSNLELSNLTLSFMMLSKLTDDETFIFSLGRTALVLLDFSDSLIRKVVNLRFGQSNLTSLEVKAPVNVSLNINIGSSKALSESTFRKLLSIPSIVILFADDNPVLNKFNFSSIQNSSVEILSLGHCNLTSLSLIEVLESFHKLNTLIIQGNQRFKTCRQLIGDFDGVVSDQTTQIVYHGRRIECFDSFLQLKTRFK